MSYFKSRWLPLALLYAGLCCSLHAVDGVVLIDQNRALAGSVTPGDAPGFPVTISQPGSYRLSGNLTVPNVDTTAIDITADNVTIDLNGFSIIGPNVCSLLACSSLPGGFALGKGVYSESRSSISVVNGSIRGIGGEGIYLSGFGSYVEKVHVDSSGAAGIAVSYGVVIGNTVTRSAVGISLSGSGTVSGNNAVGNRDVGFQIVCPTAMIGNSAALNGQNVRIRAGTGCAFTGNAL